MPADILVVDSVSTNRIVLKFKLLDAHHRVRLCETLSCARKELAACRPDLILLDVSADPQAALEFCRAHKADPEGRLVPIIATGVFASGHDRVKALEAGADEVLARPISDQLLQARIRSLMRLQDARRELALRDETHRALGFSDLTQPFLRKMSVQVISDDPAFHTQLGSVLARVPGATPGAAAVSARSLPDRLPNDMLIVDARDFDARETRLYRLISELRSRTDVRHSALLVILPRALGDAAAMALDLGANDALPADLCPQELTLRITRLLAEKQRGDLLRRTVRSGLEAAVTDALTGLFNRRYASAQLQRMAAQCRRSGRDFAVMVLDIDHFKTINDRHGHAAGDAVLREVAARLRANLRPVDLLARIGGEEFLVAVPDSDISHARNVAERLREVVGARPFRLPGREEGVCVTLSIGVSLASTLDGRATLRPDDLVEAADQALFAAKGSGRNAVNLPAA